MTFETLNLNIQTPEDDDNTDPEFIRLQGELMALKQPLLDAIANKDLPNAEELHKQALEAKAKLEAYKESLNKKESKEEEHLIDTTKQPKMPNWADDEYTIEEHNISLGIIEWNKEKYKYSLYFTPMQLFGKVMGAEIFRKMKGEKIPILNATVLDYLLEHKDQIPEEWKQDENGDPIGIYFWGTLFRHLDGRCRVRCLCWRENDWRSDKDWITVNLGKNAPAVVFAK